MELWIPPQWNEATGLWAVATRRVSPGANDIGRDCRDGLLALAKTCAKLKLLFWDYLGARLGVPGCRYIPPPARIGARQCSFTLPHLRKASLTA
jgi:hypothetical protein